MLLNALVLHINTSVTRPDAFELLWKILSYLKPSAFTIRQQHCQGTARGAMLL